MDFELVSFGRSYGKERLIYSISRLIFSCLTVGTQVIRMYNVFGPLDTKESAAIFRRRAAEEARKKRIFNPKERILGVRF